MPYSFLHHLAHALPSLAVGDVDEVDAGGQVGDVDVQRLAFARGRGHLLPERVEHHSGFQVLSHNSDLACGGVGMESGESGGFIFHNVLGQAGLSPTEGIIGDGAETGSIYLKFVV